MAIYVTRTGVALTVGIIILTGLLTGGLLWVKHEGEQARRQEAIKIAEQQLNEQSNGEVALNEGDDKPSEQEDSEKNADAEQNTGSGTGTGTGTGAGELPQTGPAESLVSILAIALLAFVGTSYARSRKLLTT